MKFINKFFSKLTFFILIFNLSLLAIDATKALDNIKSFLDIADFLAKSPRELAKLKLDLRKIKLFVNGCKKLKATDPRYPNIKVGDSKTLLKNDFNEPIPEYDVTGKAVLDESGKQVYKKLTVECNNFKDALTGVSKSLDYIKTNILGSGKNPNAVFIQILKILGLENKIPSVSELSETMDGLKYFIDRVDQVMKIPKAETPISQEPEIKEPEAQTETTQPEAAQAQPEVSSQENTESTQVTAPEQQKEQPTEQAPEQQVEQTGEQSEQQKTE